MKSLALTLACLLLNIITSPKDWGKTKTPPCQRWTISLSWSSEVHSPWFHHHATREKLQAVWVWSVLGLNKHVSDWWDERNVMIHSNQTLYHNVQTWILVILTEHSGCLLWNLPSAHFVKGGSVEPCSMVTAHRMPSSTANDRIIVLQQQLYMFLQRDIFLICLTNINNNI